MLYKESLSVLIPYIFGVDHMKYARWLPLHLRDMIGLEALHPIIYSGFSKRIFAVRKTGNHFSNIDIDQAHEQTNAVIKINGGAICFTEDSSTVGRCMVTGPEIGTCVRPLE